MGKPSTWSVTLNRDGKSQPWGIRLAGGSDLNASLIITKVYAGSPSEESLRVGDIVKKIEVYDARDLRHLDAQNLFGNADTSITLVIQREAPQQFIGSGCSSPIPSMIVNANHSTGNYTTTVNGLYGYERSVQSPVNNFCRFPPALVNVASTYDCDESPDPTVDQQPYRTNPLVLPGAKVKREQPKTVSYLRHHPNPMMRAHPSHHDQPMDTLMKQKVVHKQFNSPIGLYSEDNIAHSIKSQTGYTPYKKTVKYDPAKSETYKAIQESENGDWRAQEISKPVQPKMFTPVQGSVKNAPVSNGHTIYHKISVPHHPNPGRNSPQPHPTAPHPNADYAGISTDEIHQSGSFKRLMNMVMTEN